MNKNKIILGAKYKHIYRDLTYTLFHGDVDGDGFVELSEHSIKKLFIENFRHTWSGNIAEFNAQWKMV